MALLCTYELIILVVLVLKLYTKIYFYTHHQHPQSTHSKLFYIKEISILICKPLWLYINDVIT